MSVVVMSFNPDVEIAKKWNAEVGSPFLQLLDPANPGSPGDAGSTYLAWGLRKSFLGVWSPASLNFYSDQKLGGRETHPSYGQDVHRMGGDIMLDNAGRIVLEHYSKTNADRPLVEATILPLARALHVQAQQLASLGAPSAQNQAARSEGGLSAPAWEGLVVAKDQVKPKEECKS